MKQMGLITVLAVTLLLTGCSQFIKVDNPLPPKTTITSTHAKEATTISLFALNNYTDTPDAGLRASNLIYGVLLAKGYHVVQHTTTGSFKLQEAMATAQTDNAQYIMYGGVSEWRYKTGIDGEPAVSLQCSLVDIKTGKVVWSATASSNSWGNASVGTTAQKLIESMLSK
jgi:polysaccharide biosynthesis protein PelC